MVPVRYLYNYTGGGPHLFQFRNMVLEVNCSHRLALNISSGMNVTLQPLSLNIRAMRNIQLNIHVDVSPPFGAQQAEMSINRYLFFECNNTDPINATLRYYLNSTQLSLEMNRYVNITRMTWCYWNGTMWEPVRSRLSEDGFLEANTTHFSVWTIVEQQPMRIEEPPSIQTLNSTDVMPQTPRIQTLNYTDILPQAFTHQLQRGQATILKFSNTELYLNCTNKISLTVSAEDQYMQKSLRLEVNSGSPLELRLQLRNSKPDDVEPPHSYLGFYCMIEPNATINQVRMGMEIDPEVVQARNLDMNQLTWAYWNGAAWTPVTSTLTDGNILETETDHFSIWTILQVEETQPEITDQTGIPIPTLFITIGLAM